MTVMPILKNYDINVLVALGNQADNIVTRNKIKLLIIEKILSYNSSMFFLINSFTISRKILKEAYAEVIVMRMRDCNYSIDDSILNEILSLTSLDTLMLYGAESESRSFSHKCILEFWKRGMEIEDKFELNKKGNVKRFNLIMKKKKGDKNDKY